MVDLVKLLNNAMKYGVLPNLLNYGLKNAVGHNNTNAKVYTGAGTYSGHNSGSYRIQKWRSTKSCGKQLKTRAICHLQGPNDFVEDIIIPIDLKKELKNPHCKPGHTRL